MSGITKYNRTVWVNDQTKLNAKNMNNIEVGIETLNTETANQFSNVQNEIRLLSETSGLKKLTLNGMSGELDLETWGYLKQHPENYVLYLTAKNICLYFSKDKTQTETNVILLYTYSDVKELKEYILTLTNGQWEVLETTLNLNEYAKKTYVDGKISMVDNKKQDKLISGTNIKTLNGKTLLGAGDLSFESENDYLEQAKSISSQYQANVFFKEAQPEDTYDIVLFAGQSNMCGRATFSEFVNPEDVLLSIPTTKAITFNNGTTSNPTQIVEPISANGSSGYGMIPAIINSYYEVTKRKVCTCYMSVGGTKILKFLPYTIDMETSAIDYTTPTAYYSNMKKYINDCKTKLTAKNYKVGKIFMVWCQGEADADYLGTNSDYCTSYEKTLVTDEQKIDYYSAKFKDMINALIKDVALEHCFIIRIGHENKTNSVKYEPIIKAHNILGKTYDKCTLVSAFLAGAKVYKENDGTIRNLMRDTWHFKPEGYVRAGYESGTNIGKCVLSDYLYKPTLIEFDQVYYDSISKTRNFDTDRQVDKYLYNPTIFDIQTAQSLASDKVTSIEVIPSTLTMKINDTQQLQVKVYPENASNPDVTFISNTPDILSVTDQGLVTALANGEGEILITSVDSPTVTTTFTANVRENVISVQSVSISKKTASMKIDDTLQLTATVLPDNATNKNLVWETSDKSTAIVSNTGFVTALNEGEVIITVKSESDSTKYDTCIINITSETVVTTLLNVDFTTNTLDTYITNGLFTIPEGTTADGITYGNEGMICNSNSIKNGLKLVNPITVPDLWTIELSMKLKDVEGEVISEYPYFSLLSGQDNEQKPHTHSGSCLAPCINAFYNRAKKGISQLQLRFAEENTAQSLVGDVFLFDNQMHAYKFELAASFVLTIYRDGTQVSTHSLTANNVGSFGYLFGIHNGYPYADQYRLKTGYVIKSMKMTTTSYIS